MMCTPMRFLYFLTSTLISFFSISAFFLPSRLSCAYHLQPFSIFFGERLPDGKKQRHQQQQSGKNRSPCAHPWGQRDISFKVQIVDHRVCQQSKQHGDK